MGLGSGDGVGGSADCRVEAPVPAGEVVAGVFEIAVDEELGNTLFGLA